LHAWSIRLDDTVIEAILTSDERVRASRFHFARDRHRFVRGRSAVRQILGRYLSCEPQRLAISADCFGKPELVPRSLAFNFTNCKDSAILAISSQGDIGVDMDESHESLASMPSSTWLSCAERRAIRGISDPTVRQAALLRCWVRKEAVLKALGTGLLSSPTSVSVLESNVADFASSRGFRRFWIYDMPVPHSACWSAFAADFPVSRIRWFNFNLNEGVENDAGRKGF
jgi:4'-phosphopantetheinyl transferase